MKTSCAVGMRVSLIPQHWLRPYETGIVVDQQSQALKKWLVQFDDAFAGGGIGGGNKIWCDESDFAEVIPAGHGSEQSAHLPTRLSAADGALFPIGENGDGQKAREATQ